MTKTEWKKLDVRRRILRDVAENGPCFIDNVRQWLRACDMEQERLVKSKRAVRRSRLERTGRQVDTIMDRFTITPLGKAELARLDRLLTEAVS